jgi:putative PIN family toxin of toxin-antitoxin system
MPFEMQKIVIDTNVIVSALIGSSFPRKILFDFVFERELHLCLSNEVFEEYIEVLNREKFRKYPHFVTQAEIVLSRLLELSEKYVPTRRVSLISDESDNRILELAIAAGADFIITGNTQDFTFPDYEGIPIVTPYQFVMLFT